MVSNTFFMALVARRKPALLCIRSKFTENIDLLGCSKSISKLLSVTLNSPPNGIPTIKNLTFTFVLLGVLKSAEKLGPQKKF